MINKPALRKVIEGTREERVYLCERDFSLFLMYYFTEYIKYPFAPFHFEMFKDLKDLTEGTYREIAWIMFRESAKTSIAKIFLVWVIVFQKKKYLNVDSFSLTNAERILFDVVLSLQTNKKIKADFGELYNATRDHGEATQKRINNFITNHGVRVEAHSTGKSVRGRLHGNQRPDFLLLDDFETNETKDSKAHTEGVISHIDEFKSGLDSNAWVIYLGNLITEYGSVQTLIERAKVDERLKVRIVNVEDEEGKPTWPAKYAVTDEEAKVSGKVSLEDKKRQLGSLVYSTEMMNRPIDDSVTEFKKEYMQVATVEDIQHMNTLTFVTVDTAVSEKDSADFTGVTVNRVSEANKWYVTSYKLKVNAKGLIDHLFYIWETYSPQVIGIEETVFLLAIKPFLDDEMRKRNIFIVVQPLKHNQTSKETRIRGLIPRWESKSIFFIGNCTDLEQEMRVFPRGKHDDVLDSLAYQDQIAYAPTSWASVDNLLDEESMLYPEIGI